MGPMNGLKALAVAIFLLALAFGSGFQLLFRLGYAVLAIVSLSLVWTWLTLLGLEVTRDTRSRRAQVGQTIEDRFSLRNRLPIPKMWVEVRDHSTLGNHRASRAFAIRPGGGRSWTVRTKCTRRGRHSLGPITIVSGDPFGLFRRQKELRSAQSLIVYPATVDLSELSIPLGQLPGGELLRERSHHVTPNALGIRPYVSGDSLNRIHWLSTARLGSLTVKEFELDPLSDIWIVVDGARSAQRGRDDESTEEYAVTIAASLARHYLEQHRAVGLIVYGESHCVLPADRGSRQFLKIMEELALVRAIGRTPLAEALASESGRFGRNTTLIAVTPCVDDSWVIALRHETLRGVRGVAVLIDAASFGGIDSTSNALNALAATQIPTFLVRRTDDLGQALAAPSSGSLYGLRL